MFPFYFKKPSKIDFILLDKFKMFTKINVLILFCHKSLWFSKFSVKIRSEFFIFKLIFSFDPLLLRKNSTSFCFSVKINMTRKFFSNVWVFSSGSLEAIFFVPPTRFVREQTKPKERKNRTTIAMAAKAASGSFYRITTEGKFLLIFDSISMQTIWNVYLFIKFERKKNQFLILEKPGFVAQIQTDLDF